MDARLPTIEQYRLANKYLVLAGHESYAACIPFGILEGEIYARGCIVSVKLAATALGFELVQRVTPAETVPDGARDA